MGQDEVYLQVITETGTSSERHNAQRVLGLLKKGKHWVLVTMLLSNVITNETLPIVLDRCLGGGWPAVVSSTILIVIFGEVIPQSVSVRYGLSIGALFTPFVMFLMYAMYPVAYPTALLLDRVLGEDHGTVYRKAQLKSLVSLHRSMGSERLNRDEVTIISAVLDLNEKPVGTIMTPIQDVYTMSADRILDEAAVEEILKAGYSRIPIHTPDEPYNFIGMLLVRILISYDPEDAQPVSSFPLATLPETRPDTTCLNVLNYFQEGKSHMMLVSDAPGEAYGALGVLTLEDVIEELIGEEIVDESDVYIDISQGIRRKYVSPLTRRTLPSQFVAQHQHNSVIVGNNSSNELGSSGHSTSHLPLNNNNDRSDPLVQSLISAIATPQSSSSNTPVGTVAVTKPAHPNINQMPKMEPLNLAMRPKQTANSRVKIKRGAMEDYVRRTSLDANRPNTNSSRYSGPSNTDFGVIHESESAALLDGPPEPPSDPFNSSSRRASSSGSSTTKNGPQRRPSFIELNHLDSRSNSFNNAGYERVNTTTPGSVISEPASATSTSRLLDGSEYPTFEAGWPNSSNSEFHASGIMESVREVHGYKKTIIQSMPMQDAISSGEDSEDDGGSDESSGGSSRGNHHHHHQHRKDHRSNSNNPSDLERGEVDEHGDSITSYRKKKNGKSSRKGSFFSVS
ncbi:hypothetical protein BZA70DRAFT_199489 [Myxozyma melibiosi]|uniref:Uncharacterized protein n=1 Tax=Myxozyma melibiosi TaxID=54550 RepID=A0ABR1F2I8_9ASCO